MEIPADYQIPADYRCRIVATKYQNGRSTQIKRSFTDPAKAAQYYRSLQLQKNPNGKTGNVYSLIQFYENHNYFFMKAWHVLEKRLKRQK
jgi:hypothetical protein